MRSSFLFLIMALFLGACASAPTIDGMKATSEKEVKEIYEAAKEGDSKFLFGEFSDHYKGDEKIKKIAIVYYSIGWDKSADLRDESGSTIDPGYYQNNYQNLVNASMEEMKARFERYGYKIITPDELAEMSPTFKAIQEQKGLNHYSPNSGQELVGLGVKGSRYIHMMTHEGKLLSKIHSEATEVDAFLGFNMNSLGRSGTKWLLDGVRFYGVNAAHDAQSFLCVPRSKAEKNKVRLGWIGDANDCARAQALFKMSYFLPAKEEEGKKAHQEIKDLTFSNMEKAYRSVGKGLAENFYEEGLK
jgi:hypothetical protein